MQRDWRTWLAHGLGRTADYARGQGWVPGLPASVTAIEREEAGRRRAAELQALWTQEMVRFQRAGERADPYAQVRFELMRQRIRGGR